MPHTNHQHMQRCIDDCVECHAMCLESVPHCLELGGQHAAPPHIKTLLDCAQICQTSADSMIRGSDRHHRTCAVCAEVCQECADDCERLGDDQMMRECADMCRRCAESCRQMASAGV